MKQHAMAAKRKRIHQLRLRGEGLDGELTKQSEINKNIESKIDALSEHVRAFHAKNVELSQMVEEELLKRDTYQDIIESLEAQTEVMEKKYTAQRARYQSVAKENEMLCQELDKLKAKKSAYHKYIKLAEGNLAAADVRNRNLKTNLGQMDIETKELQGFQEKAKSFYKEEGLKERVARLAGNEKKTGLALYTCLQGLIHSIEENEFEGVRYRSRVDKSKTKMGARLYFTNITSQYSDVISHLSPVIQEMGKRFGKYGMRIETKAKKTATGIVSALDIKVVLNTSLATSKSPQDSL